MDRRLFYVLIFSLAALVPSARARDWFVNPGTGNDQQGGSESNPLATAQAAVDRASDGDRVVLLPANAVYRQSINLDKAKTGLIIEGNGVSLSGADPLDATSWESLGDDLFRTKLPLTLSNRHLLIVNGRSERMGQSPSKASDQPAAAALQPGQFRWDPLDEKSGWITVKGPTENLEWSVRENGISGSGSIRNIKIYNLSARHFLNAGFNIQGDSRGLQFFSIRSEENFASGFSSGGSSECWVNSSRFSGNGIGVADVGKSDSYYTDCVIEGNREMEVSFKGGRHSLTRCRIIPGKNSAPLAIQQSENKKTGAVTAPTSLVMQTVEFDLSGSESRHIEIGPASHVYHDSATGKSLTPLNVEVHPSSEITESLYHTYAIGRNATGTPIMAWAGGATRGSPSQAYRIIHFGKYVPQDVAPKLLPDNDWLGLLAPLDTSKFPPSGPAFEPDNSSAHAIWRWIGLTAPDAVFVPDTPEGRALGKALQDFPPAGVGMINVFINRGSNKGVQESIVLPNTVNGNDMAKDEMRKRLARTPQEVINQLSEHYGNRFAGSYIEALALIAKKEAGITNRSKELAKEYLEKVPAALKSGGEIAGTLLYTGIEEPWAQERVLKVAGLAFDPEGNPLEAMPFHNEMSDAIFMASPLLARAGEISGEKRYFDQCFRNFTFIENLCRRSDGLYQHSPLTEAAWGRGNGFPALGLALVLPHFPDTHEGYPVLLAAFRDHLAALAKYQDTNGMWHQVIDHPDSYAELTATCMIGYAIAVGIESHWIEASEWQPRLDQAWNAVKMHISTDGKTLINVCTGTGKQPNLEAYYRREAILGSDDRGGAMALMFAAEMKKSYTQ